MNGPGSTSTTPPVHTGFKALIVAVALVSLSLAGCVSDGGDATGTAATDPSPMALEAIPLVNHIQAGMAEQDVFVDEGDGEGVYRVSVADAADPALQDAPLYASAEPQEHDPSSQELGPFEKGAPLGFTLGEWLDGRGAIAYACQDGEATFDASFANLVPNGVYTIWYARLTMEEGAMVGVAEMPLGAPDGSQNRFVAGEDGSATFHLAGFDCVEPTEMDDSGTGVSTAFAAAYHSDGKTYADEPGDFGRVTHVQLFAMAKAVQEG